LKIWALTATACLAAGIAIAVYLGPDGKIVAVGFYPPRPLPSKP